MFGDQNNTNVKKIYAETIKAIIMSSQPGSLKIPRQVVYFYNKRILLIYHILSYILYFGSHFEKGPKAPSCRTRFLPTSFFAFFETPWKHLDRCFAFPTKKMFSVPHLKSYSVFVEAILKKKVLKHPPTGLDFWQHRFLCYLRPPKDI